MREMKDSGIPWIGEIPKEWKILKIKYLVDGSQETAFLDGDWIDSPYITDNGIPYFTTGNVGDGYFKKSDNGYISDETFKNLNCKYAYSGDLVISRLNEPYGRSCILPADIDKCILAVDIVILRPKKDIDKQYICYVSQCSGYQNSVLDYARGTTMKRISRINLGNVAIPIPSLPEQQKISDFLDRRCGEVDALAAEVEKQIETLEDYKRSAITEAVTKGLNPAAEMKPSGVKWIGEIPKGWKLRRGKYLFRLRNEKGNNVCLQLLSPTQKFGVIPQDRYDELSGMSAVKLNEKADLNLMKTIRKGDFCISLRSFQGGFEYSTYEGVVSPAYQVFYPTVKVSDGYYKYLFKERSFIEKMNSYTMTLRDGKTIAFSDFGNTYIPYPPVDEQQQISDFLDDKCAEIDGIVADKKSQLQVLADYKKSLIYEYVTGKKEVPCA